MQEKSSKRAILKVGLILIGAIILGVLGYRFLIQPAKISGEDWAGIWDVSYFYENEPNLLYTGSLHINSQDSLSGYLEIYAPKSTQPETLTLQDFSILENANQISGYVVHNQYKIRGGYMREFFELTLDSKEKISGKGKCLEYCAEGTQDWEIILQANK